MVLSCGRRCNLHPCRPHTFNKGNEALGGCFWESLWRDLMNVHGGSVVPRVPGISAVVLKHCVGRVHVLENVIPGLAKDLPPSRKAHLKPQTGIVRETKDTR